MDISIHALREEGDLVMPQVSQQSFISIHALREEGDLFRPRRLLSGRYFYPRPPRGGRRNALAATLIRFLFLSTPSARRATFRAAGYSVDVWISIHALREEGDGEAGQHSFMVLDFYPRPPRGGRRRH